jgi:hypothetical protein
MSGVPDKNDQPTTVASSLQTFLKVEQYIVNVVIVNVVIVNVVIDSSLALSPLTINGCLSYNQQTAALLSLTVRLSSPSAKAQGFGLATAND